MTQEIANFLETTNATAPEMTHYLCEFGNGDMGRGIRNLLFCGGGIGSAATIIIIGGSYWIYRIATKKQRMLRKIETVGTSFNAGFEIGRRQEREFQQFVQTVEHNGEEDFDNSNVVMGGR